MNTAKRSKNFGKSRLRCTFVRPGFFIMALAQDIAIYKQMKDLLRFIVRERSKFPKSYRSLGQDMFVQATRCLSLIHLANMQQATRARYLMELTAEFGTLGTVLEVCTELKVWSTTTAAQAALLVDNIGRQITGWRQSSTRPER